MAGHKHTHTYALHSPSMPMMNTSPQTVPMHLYGLVGHAICIRASAMYVRTITPMAGRASSERPSVAYRNRIESCTVSDIGTCKSSRCTVLRGTWSATRGNALIIVVILRAN